MPKYFSKCVKSGGRVITKSLEGGKYIHLCKKGGKWFKGEVKEAKNKRRKK